MFFFLLKSKWVHRGPHITILKLNLELHIYTQNLILIYLKIFKNVILIVYI